MHSDKNHVKHLYDELQIRQILNIGYSPEFNAIESCFSQVKRVYIRERLRALANDVYFDEVVQIKTALKEITKELVGKCARKSLHLL